MAGTLTSASSMTPMLHQPMPVVMLGAERRVTGGSPRSSTARNRVERSRRAGPDRASTSSRHEWVRTWWECFGAGCQLHIVIVRAEGRIVAIAPLLSDTTRMCGISIRPAAAPPLTITLRATDFIVVDRAESRIRRFGPRCMTESATDGMSCS